MQGENEMFFDLAPTQEDYWMPYNVRYPDNGMMGDDDETDEIM